MSRVGWLQAKANDYSADYQCTAQPPMPPMPPTPLVHGISIIFHNLPTGFIYDYFNNICDQKYKTIYMTICETCRKGASLCGASEHPPGEVMSTLVTLIYYNIGLLCVIIWLFRQLFWEEAYSHWSHFRNFCPSRTVKSTLDRRV